MIHYLLPDPFIPDQAIVEAGSVSTPTLAVSTGWPANNAARYQPVYFPADCTLYSLSFLGGNTTGNYDLGLYDSDYNRLASKGSTAMAASVQTLTLPEIRVRAGRVYYAALAFSAAASFLRFGPTQIAFTGMIQAQEASALPLPSTMTPVAGTTTAVMPAFAFGVR